MLLLSNALPLPSGDVALQHQLMRLLISNSLTVAAPLLVRSGHVAVQQQLIIIIAAQQFLAMSMSLLVRYGDSATVQKLRLLFSKSLTVAASLLVRSRHVAVQQQLIIIIAAQQFLANSMPLLVSSGISRDCSSAMNCQKSW